MYFGLYRFVFFWAKESILIKSMPNLYQFNDACMYTKTNNIEIKNTQTIFSSRHFFSVRLLSVLRGHSVFSSPPKRPMTFDFEGFLYVILSITLFSYLNSWERASISFFNVENVLNKGTTGTIFITSLVWRGPWLGIEPGTSRTRCQYSTTRLSRRRCPDIFFY